MPVNTENTEYQAHIKQVEVVRDCVAGSDAVKSRGGGQASGVEASLSGMQGARYLPPPNAADTSADNRARFAAYRHRASFVNFTGQTKEGMLGMVFRKPIDIAMPAALEYLITNADGGGLGLDQLARGVASDVLESGRHGFLVEYPEAAANLTIADVASLNLQANIISYPAESIINWRTAMVGGMKKMSLVVLRESVQEIAPDGFDVEVVDRFRVLELLDGIYIQRLFDKDGKIIQTTGGEDFTAPSNFDGSTWSEIPFVFIGAQNNDETIDKAPLYDIAEVNIAHYRNSADYEESSFQVGQPTLAIAGLTQTWVDSNFANGVQLGARAAIMLPEVGSASLLQSSPNSMPREGMQDKEQQMIKIGARIIQDSSGQETAEAARIRYAGQNSKLGLLVGNIEAALTKACEFALQFMAPASTSPADISIVMNKEFYEAKVDPQEIMADIQLLDRAVIAKSDLQDKLRRAGSVTRSNEEIDAEAGSVSPIV